MAHAYLVTGDLEEGKRHALQYAQGAWSLEAGHPDVTVLSYGLFSVEEARHMSSLALRAPLQGTHTVIVLAAERLFHEAQNALLKIFEEPPLHTTLVLVVPTDGLLLPTLRSRLAVLPQQMQEQTRVLHPFVKASAKEREAFLTKLLAAAKGSSDASKQAARSESVRIVEDLIRHVYTATPQDRVLLRELDRFLPMLHERSAPLKLIFEHLLLVTPEYKK